MNYLSHGYINIFNHEIGHASNNALQLITNSKDIIFQTNEINNYNSKDLVDKIFEKILLDLNNQSSIYSDVQLKKSSLRFTPKGQPHNSHSFYNQNLKIKLHPSEDTAEVFMDDLNIIATFNNEISCIKQDYIMKKRIVLEKDCSELITIPHHGIQISLNHCLSYNKFKKIMINSLYKDIEARMVSALKILRLSKWDIILGQTKLDVENVINDNMKILIA